MGLLLMCVLCVSNACLLVGKLFVFVDSTKVPESSGWASFQESTGVLYLTGIKCILSDYSK